MTLKTASRIAAVALLAGAIQLTVPVAYGRKSIPTSCVITGTLTAKGDVWIDVLPAKKNAVPERFIPQDVDDPAKNGKGYDRDILEAFAELKPGDHVGIKWTLKEQKRVVEIWEIDGK